MKRTTIIITLIVIVIIIGISQAFFKKTAPNFTLAEVIRGNISQEISETGQVEKGDKINLTFKNSGRIEKIYVEVGEEVNRGDVLAKLETSELQIQLQEAKSNLAIAQAKLNKLLVGATQEEIQSLQTKVENSQIALNTANQNLADAYEDSLIILDDVYLKAYNSQNTANLVQRTYFTSTNQTGLKVKENKEIIESNVLGIKSLLDFVEADPSQSNIDLVPSQIKEKLSIISASLKIIREACEEPDYRNLVSSTDKTSLDTHRTNINTALTNTVNSQQTISAAKLAVDSAQGELRVAKDNLALTIAAPRQEDIDLYQAQLGQAEAQVKLYETQIYQARIIAPVAGVVAEIKKKTGELVQPVLHDSIITLVPAAPYQIKVDVYEEDVVKVNIDNPVEISLIALPVKTFQGRVISINPAEKIIDGVVYYEIIISFDEAPENIKPGMTTDVIIKTATQENVLIISRDALQIKDNKTVVEVFKDNKIEEKEVVIGLEGSNDMVEVVSGLVEGEKIILR